MTLTCAICHGWGIYFFLADEGLPQGSNWTLEVASWPSVAASVSKGMPFPHPGFRR